MQDPVCAESKHDHLAVGAVSEARLAPPPRAAHENVAYGEGAAQVRIRVFEAAVRSFGDGFPQGAVGWVIIPNGPPRRIELANQAVQGASPVVQAR